MSLLLATILSLATFAGAHPGHGSTIIMGTLKSVSKAEVAIEVRDVATLSLLTMRVEVDDDTKYRMGKDAIEAPWTHVGARVVASVDYEEGPDGNTVYRATEIVLSKPKSRP